MCLAAGAVLHPRDGHTVATDYGSVAAEMAVGMKSVGLADRSDSARGSCAVIRTCLTAASCSSAHMMPSPSCPPIGAGRDCCVDLPHRDVRSTVALLSLIGPRGARLLHAAGLPGELMDVSASSLG